MEFRRVLLRSDLLAGRPVRIDGRRHFVVRADLQKVRLELVAGADIDRMHIVFESQLLQHDMDLMAVRRRPGIELDGIAVSPTQEEGCSLAELHGTARTLIRCGRHWRIASPRSSPAAHSAVTGLLIVCRRLEGRNRPDNPARTPTSATHNP